MTVHDAVSSATKWLRSRPIGDPRIEQVLEKLIRLADHAKWEVRREVATASAYTRHDAFESVLVKLSADDNNFVRQAALHAMTRRRDWANASSLGTQHAERINATLDDIEARFGLRGRNAVKRAAEEIAHTFARELHHEVIKVISPLAASAQRLHETLLHEDSSKAEIAGEAERIKSRVTRLQAFIDAMRAYTAQPKVTFRTEPLKDIVDESVALVRDRQSAKTLLPGITILVDSQITVDIDRTRFVQALTNLLQNAIESYDNADSLQPITIRAAEDGPRIVLSVEDSGCGMTQEALRDAAALFSTSKSYGTGFGLPLAMKIIESEHEGRLLLESAKGKGTIARITLPKRQP